MDALILITYFTVVWLVYFKFKLLPWNVPNVVAVFTIPIVGLTTLMMLLNIFTPSTTDIRVMNRTVEVVPNVAGLVVDIPVKENTPVEKGDTLFVIDQTPFKIQVRQIEAALKQADATLIGQNHQLRSLKKQETALRANKALALKRVEEFTELLKHNAGNKFDLESAETKVLELDAKLQAIKAQEDQLYTQITTTFEGEQVSIAQLHANLDKAKWDLSNTVYLAPANGYVTNLQLRKGARVVSFPFKPAMTFIEDEKFIVATFMQNELHQVVPGNTVEFTLKTLPGKMFTTKVETVVWQQGVGRGQMPATGLYPDTAPKEPGRYVVRLAIPEEDAHLLKNGSTGDAAIFTTHSHPMNIIRMVILRIGAKMNYIIPKLH